MIESIIKIPAAFLVALGYLEIGSAIKEILSLF